MSKAKRKVVPRRSAVLREMVMGVTEPIHENYIIITKILNEDLLSTIFFEIEKIERMKQAKASQKVIKILK